MSRRPTPVLAAFALVSLLTASARADTSSVAAAEALFREGRALIEGGRFVEACDRFARSDELDPAVGTRLSLGECYERLGRSASAWAAYNQAAGLATQRRDLDRASVARKRIEELEPRLAHLTIQVEAPVPDLVVTQNGAEVGHAALDTPLPVDAGPHVIAAQAPGHAPWETTVDVRDGERRTVLIAPLTPVRQAPATAAPSPADEAPPSGARRTIALGLELGGAVAIVSGLALGGVAIARWSSVTETCPDGRCPTEADRQSLAPDVRAARTFATVSTITTAVGVVALATGIVLHLTAPTRRVAVAPVFDRAFVGVAGHVGF